MFVMSVVPNSYKLPLIHLLELNIPIPSQNIIESQRPYEVVQTVPSNPSYVLPRLSDVVALNVPQMKMVPSQTLSPQPPQVSVSSSNSCLNYSTPAISRPSTGFISPILLPPYSDRLSALCAAATTKRTLLEPDYLAATGNLKFNMILNSVPPIFKIENDANELNITPKLELKVEPTSGSTSSITSPTQSDSSATVSVTTNTTNTTGKVWKPRKKRQCPECNLFFSNLATHKSTHLKLTLRPHICEYCSRGFARPNDLFRHVKRHWKETGSDKGQFKCPFKLPASSEDRCCHQSGIFLRCDTYKNHLKAIHFQYPAGTRKDQRNKVAGSCRACQQSFMNVDEWMANHVEKNACPCAKEHN